MASLNFKTVALPVLAIAVIGGGLFWLSQSGGIGSKADTTASASATRTITHSKGETQVPASPQKVAVFDLIALDTLEGLGVTTVAGVPDAKYPPSLAKYADAAYPKVGSLFEPNYEAVNALQPDLIITGGRASAKYAELAKVGTAIDLVVDPTNYIGSAIKNAETLGVIFGKEAEAKARVDALNTSIAALKTQTATKGKGLIVLTTGNKMSAYGPGSRFGALHTDFGVPAAAEGLDTTTHGEAIGSEFILETNPDWLFVIDRDAAIGQGVSAQKMLDNDLVRQTKAWKDGRVVYLNATDWYLLGGGLRATQNMVNEVAAAYAKAP